MLSKKLIKSDRYLLDGLHQEIKIMGRLKSKCVVELIDVLETGINN